MKKADIPLGERDYLSLKEAAVYFNIGINKIREITNDENCQCVLWVGNKRMIKRERFKEFLDEAYSV